MRDVRPRGYFYCALATTFNIVVYVVTFGRYLWLEGRVRSGSFSNWLRRYRYRPRRFVQPTTGGEIVALVQSSRGLRVVGAGHSFNAGVVADDTLVSLDCYRDIVWKDLERKRVAFRGGTRVRDASKALLRENLAFEALPSHDAQSLASILATDVHGTGQRVGFVSEQVVSLKLVDGRGDVHECAPSDDLFRAAVGGIGATGIITEVVVQAVDRFNVQQRFERSKRPDVWDNLDHLLADNAHLSLYLFPFTTTCQINTWNRTDRRKSLLAPLQEFLDISLDALLAAWAGNFLAYSGLLPRCSSRAHRMKPRGRDLVMESYQAFNRTIYHLHQELEFTVPYEDTVAVCNRFVQRYEEMYREAPLPYTLFEIRFTPAGHDRTLIGPGRGRRSTWIDLLTNDSRGFERYFAAAAALVREVGGRPHPGKFFDDFTREDLVRVHRDQFRRFLDLGRKYDPERKFANAFTRRIFWDG